MYTQKQQTYLLELAHQAISSQLGGPELIIPDTSHLDPVLLEKRATFVTITISGQLRGCIGHLEPVQPLYLDVIENARSAAFDDPRFSPLSKAELSQTEIEISVLTLPQPLLYRDRDDLLAKLTPETGVILKQGRHQATYLPQVWAELPSKEAFLSSLCHKAGLGSNEWEKGHLEVEIYTVESF